MVDAIESLVQHEGPVHIDVAFERLRKWWGIGRVGSSIRNNINLAIQQAPVLRDGDFLTLADEDVAHVRTPSSDVARKVEQVHLDELSLAVIMMIRDVGAAGRSEVAQGVARIRGWTRTGAIVERRINEAIVLLVDDGEIIDSDGTLTNVRQPPGDGQ